MTILLFGTGHAAFHLGHAFVKAGVEVVGVVGRDEGARAKLADLLGTRSIAKKDPLPKAEVILIAVSDDAIGKVARKLVPRNTVIAHCSGARALDVLSPHEHQGVLWPIQTLGSNEPIDLRQVPIVIDGNTAHARDTMQTLATTISEHVTLLRHEERQRVHLAAVLTSNMPVFLIREGQRLLREAGIPAQLMDPLWHATVDRINTLGPEDALTGPARRGDIRTVKQHIDQLVDDPDLRDAYALLSKLIMRTYGH